MKFKKMFPGAKEQADENIIVQRSIPFNNTVLSLCVRLVNVTVVVVIWPIFGSKSDREKGVGKTNCGKKSRNFKFVKSWLRPLLLWWFMSTSTRRKSWHNDKGERSQKMRSEIVFFDHFSRNIWSQQLLFVPRILIYNILKIPGTLVPSVWRQPPSRRRTASKYSAALPV